MRSRDRDAKQAKGLLTSEQGQGQSHSLFCSVWWENSKRWECVDVSDTTPPGRGKQAGRFRFQFLAKIKKFANFGKFGYHMWWWYLSAFWIFRVLFMDGFL